MEQKTVATRVPFKLVNVEKCCCTRCPVQTHSSCVKEKVSRLEENILKDPLVPEEVPGVYCSTGAAECRDLDIKQNCKCFTCNVWGEYRLAAGAPVGHFCREGASR
jgi:hypothetical protein